jgi:antitoxin PrlF
VVTSKLTSKAQTTIPQPVRAALRLREGDEIAYAIEGDRVVLTRAVIEPMDDPFTCFGEWGARRIGGPMPGFDAWDVIKVPFPYTDRPVRQRRPALITSAENRGWPGDVAVSDLAAAGLPRRGDTLHNSAG